MTLKVPDNIDKDALIMSLLGEVSKLKAQIRANDNRSLITKEDVNSYGEEMIDFGIRCGKQAISDTGVFKDIEEIKNDLLLIKRALYEK